ncbi:MAG: hypothetical protein OFPII_43850 [Osedax symbiont Rs1]|nr:MAG: hypothetical protein OFPII_43850 [Osedax symbiont Rs1]
MIEDTMMAFYKNTITKAEKPQTKFVYYVDSKLLPQSRLYLQSNE